MKDETIPLRKDIPAEYKWDLTQLYKTDEEWEADLKKIPSLVKNFSSFKGRLSESSSIFLEDLKALH